MNDTPNIPECKQVVTTFGPDHLHCGYTVEQMQQIDLSPFAPLAGGELVLPGDLLFLDTETTGLSGGAGTVAFLLGVGHFCDDGFIIKQYLMRDYDEEQSLLNHLQAELGSRGALVTYNGKTFDINLLESRFIMNGMRLPRVECHIDLLHPSRRIWRRCLENCRLSTIEKEILGERRVEDIPGHLIPQVYFEYLETREMEAMEMVLLHNRLDILAMVAVLKYVLDLAERVRVGMPYEKDTYKLAATMSAGKFHDRTAEELLGFAGFFYSIKDKGMAERCLKNCLERDKPAVRRRAMTLLAEIKKRDGDYLEAARYWEGLLAFAPASGIYPYIELAKYYEHKAHNPAKAKVYADQAHNIAAGPVFRDSVARREIEARRERLSRKIEKQASRRNTVEYVEVT
ncbi:MAG: ribonuclease H-like domain-containing protein [Oscillospiraceae bacterium]|nr:ribonuclease H-like domain-containing protein [Oscillospiraceae bacterium]